MRLARPWVLAAIALIPSLGACRSSLEPPDFERFDPLITPNASDFPDVGGVVLLDRGTLFLTVDEKTGNPIARLRRLRRVKILRSFGKDLAEVRVPYDGGTLVAHLKARAVLPSGGAVEAQADDAVEEEDDRGRKTKIIRVASGEPDTIVEMTYDLWIGDPRFIPPWVFQANLPTMRSEYSVVVPPGFSVDLRFSEGGAFIERTPERFETDEGTRFFWTLTKLPALFSEPGMPSPELLAPRAHVVMVGARVGGREYGGFGSWDEVGRWFLSLAPEWAKLSPASAAEAKRVAGETSEEEKALKLLALVARDLPWEPGPRRALFQTRVVPAETVLGEKRGNATTRGLLLTALIRSLGIHAYPALVAYRDHGILLPDLPTAYELEGVVAVIPRANGPLFLDPSQLTVSADVPPPRIQGTQVVALREDGAEVVRVPVSAPEHSRTTVAYELKVDDRGDLTGSVDAVLTGAEAGELREALLATPPERYADVSSDFLRTRGAALRLESASIADLTELRRPLTIKGRVTLKRAFKGEGAELSMKLGRILGSSEGPASREVRRTPLKVGAPNQVEVTATLTLPESWEVGPPIPSIESSWSGGRVQITMRAESPRRIALKRTSIMTVLDVEPDEYFEFRTFRQSVKSADDQPIAVKRPAPRTLEY